jgi:Ca2+/Na+ antiporter
MKSKFTSIFTFGLLLLVISFVLSYTSYNDTAKIFSKIGVIFELYALVLYLINRYKKSKNG